MTNDVLLVEDTAPIRLLITEFLNRKGYRVHAFGSAEEAQAYLEGASPNVAILDVGLPGQGGDDLGVEIQLKSPGTRVIFFTAQDDVGWLETRVPGCEIVSKRGSLAELIGLLPTRHSPKLST